MEFAFWRENRNWNLREYEISYLQENVEFVLYTMLAFFVPFFLAQPQILVGAIVNAALIMAGLNLRGWKSLPIILLPSIGVLAAGVIFGGLSPFLIYMIPFIWISNAVLVFAVKEFVLGRGMNKLLGIGIGIVAKVALLFGVSFALVLIGVLPVAFLAVMGIMQLYSAVIGAIAALSVQGAKRAVF